MKLKNVLIIGTALMFLLSGSMAFAAGAGQDKDGEGYYIHSVTGKTKYFESHPGEPSQWRFVGGPNDGCEGPECSASGNYDLNVLALGGGIDCDLAIIPNGFAGGVSAAGGLALGKAEGAFDSWFFGPLGGAYGDLSVVGGGLVLTESGAFYPGIGDLSIGVRSRSFTIATAQAMYDVDAWGLAYSDALVLGITGQGSLDTSLLWSSPLPMWDSKGVTGGLAAQGSVGGFIGGGIAAGYGSAEAGAEITMLGQTGSSSYRAIDFNGPAKTEIMGTEVYASTVVLTDKYVDNDFIGIGGVKGGYVAGGIAATKTIQATQGGLATASARGAYNGSGELGCNFNGSAVGYTRTTATTVKGMKGSIMSSSAGMSVGSSVTPN